jgi:Domain of unknown function (DUF4326)
MPKRLQRKHFRERMPPGSVGVARPSFFGNAFDTETYGPPEVCVVLFEAEHEQNSVYRAAVVHYLRGKDLWCYCDLAAPCHADVLLRWANAPAPAAG